MFDVAEAAGFGLLWSRLFFLLVRSFWAIVVLLLVSAIFCLLSFLWMLVLLRLRRMFIQVGFPPGLSAFL